NGIYIIDLQITLRQIYKAYGLVRESVANGGSVLFVGTKKQAQEPVAQHANRCGQYYVHNRWLGGTLTNFKTVRGSIQELNNLQGLQRMPRLTSVVFIADARREYIAVREAKRLGIPSIGIVDTNCDPAVVDLAIPGNGDAIRAIDLYCSVIADAVLEGKMRA